MLYIFVHRFNCLGENCLGNCPYQLRICISTLKFTQDTVYRTLLLNIELLSLATTNCTWLLRFKFIKIKQDSKASLVFAMLDGWHGHQMSPSVQNALLGSIDSAHDDQRDFA